MSLGVARDAQSLKVVPVEGQLLHLRERVRRLHRHLVMHVDGRAYQPLSLAPLAQRMRPQILLPQHLPPLRVQQPLVVFASAHRFLVLK